MLFPGVVRPAVSGRLLRCRLSHTIEHGVAREGSFFSRLTSSI